MSYTNKVLIDVTTVISAQQQIENEFKPNWVLFDPFAEDAYNELIQTLLFFDDVYISHPSKLDNCRAEDFGQKPELLQKLFQHNLVKILTMTQEQITTVQQSDATVYSAWLEYNNTGETILDDIFANEEFSELTRVWSNYQHSVGVGHKDRIVSDSGVENDVFGNFATKYSQQNKNTNAYIVATIIRSLKYRTRARVCGLIYQPHPIRNEFVFKSILADEYKSYARHFVDGVNDFMASNQSQDRAMDMVKLKVPVFGGLLWQQEDIVEARKNSLDQFLDLVVKLILYYRDRLAPFRERLHGIQNNIAVNNIVQDLQIIINQMIYMHVRPEEMRDWVFCEISNCGYVSSQTIDMVLPQRISDKIAVLQKYIEDNEGKEGYASSIAIAQKYMEKLRQIKYQRNNKQEFVEISNCISKDLCL